MDTFWNEITRNLTFTGIHTKELWQEIIFGLFLNFLSVGILLLKDFIWDINPQKKFFGLTKKTSVRIFLTELKALNEQGEIDRNPRYVVQYYKRTVRNRNNIGNEERYNIDPVWPDAEGRVLGNIYYALGRINFRKDIQISNLINDWSKNSDLTFSIGFNPKTHLYLEKSPYDFIELARNQSSGLTLGLKNGKKKLNAISPYDAGIMQKTTYKGKPVFLLAGLGICGTEAAGKLFEDHYKHFARLYGKDPFAILIRTNINEGTENYEIVEMTKPKNNLHIIFNPFLYFKYKKFFIGI